MHTNQGQETTALCDSPSIQTSSITYSRFPAPGIGIVFAKPSSSIIVSMAEDIVVVREMNSLYLKSSGISGTREKCSRTESSG